MTPDEKLAEIAEKFKYRGLTPDNIKSIAFWLVDYWMENLSQDAIDAGAYHNHGYNGDDNMIKSFQEILWASYEEMDGQKPQTPGPWVTIDPLNGIQIHKERPRYVVD